MYNLPGKGSAQLIQNSVDNIASCLRFRALYSAYAMEMNLAWNLTERERLTLLFCVGIGMASKLSMVFFCFKQRAVRNPASSLYFLLAV